MALAALFLSLAARPLAAEPSPGEKRKIEALLDQLSAKTDLTFVRNGKKYKADKAAAHLRTKLKRAGDRISTCQEFIDHLASKSSISGEPYLVITASGATGEAREYFSGLLKEIEASGAP